MTVDSATPAAAEDRLVGALNGDPSLSAADAVADADPALLLASLAAWLGDPGLVDRYGSAFRPRSVAGPTFTIFRRSVEYDVDPEVVDTIRRMVLDELNGLTSSVGPGCENDPFQQVSDEAFQRIASFVMGEDVDDDVVQILREQGGFEKDRRHVQATRKPGDDFEVLIVGGGMSGINAGIKLGEAGFTYKIFESRDDFGGTWVGNTYPGAAVDTPSLHYSFSFEPDPDWQLHYPQGPEYRDYLHRVADKYGVTEHIQVNTTVESCVWDDESQRWQVTTECGGRRTTHRARALITAVGFLNRPHQPRFDGEDEFSGVIMHTAEWDDTVELAGKNVVLLGAGCTAVQVATSVAPIAANLAIVQRHPQWVVPANTEAPVPLAERWRLSHIPYYHHWQRLRGCWFSGLRMGRAGLMEFATVDPEWAATHVSASPINDALMQKCLRHIEESFHDRPDLKAKMTPDYPPGVKRLIMDPGYYTTVKRDNVEVHNGSIDHLEPGAVVLTDGTRVPCDVLICATGFTADWLSTIDIRGRGGANLNEVWGGDPWAYLGVCVPQFPNFFVTCGPNSLINAVGHNLTCEQQVHYAMECLQLLVENDYAAFEPTVAAADEYTESVRDAMATTIYYRPSVRSYHHNAEGRPLVWSPWSGRDFWALLKEPKVEDLVFFPHLAQR
jgi:4-hydroxyacetophenone monooxygenase